MCPLVQHKMQLQYAVKLVEMKTKYFPHPNINLSTKSCGVFLFSRYNNIGNCCKTLSKDIFFPADPLQYCRTLIWCLSTKPCGFVFGDLSLLPKKAVL